jgi:hypothetical protein
MKPSILSKKINSYKYFCKWILQLEPNSSQLDFGWKSDFGKKVTELEGERQEGKTLFCLSYAIWQAYKKKNAKIAYIGRNYHSIEYITSYSRMWGLKGWNKKARFWPDKGRMFRKFIFFNGSEIHFISQDIEQYCRGIKWDFIIADDMERYPYGLSLLTSRADKVVIVKTNH